MRPTAAPPNVEGAAPAAAVTLGYGEQSDPLWHEVAGHIEDEIGRVAGCRDVGGAQDPTQTERDGQAVGPDVTGLEVDRRGGRSSRRERPHEDRPGVGLVDHSDVASDGRGNGRRIRSPNDLERDRRVGGQLAREAPRAQADVCAARHGGGVAGKNRPHRKPTRHCLQQSRRDLPAAPCDSAQSRADGSPGGKNLLPTSHDFPAAQQNLPPCHQNFPAGPYDLAHSLCDFS